MNLARAVLIVLAFGAGQVNAQARTLEIAVDQSPVGLDPHLATAFSTFAIVGQIYDGLVELNAQLQIEPALALDWQISEDGLEYTFQLRPGVTFHNGRAFTSADVVNSFNRIVAPDTSSPFASRFTLVDSVEATGDLEVVFNLSEPFAPFLSNLVDLTVVPIEVVNEFGDLQQRPVGTGAFMFTEWVPDSYLLLSANPNYYRSGEPAVAALRYNIVPDATTRASGLRTGAFHVLLDVDPATALALQGSPGIEIMSVDDLAASRFGLNVAHPALADPRVREAINYALDREEIIEAVYFGDGVAGGAVSPALTDWAVPIEQLYCFEHDPERAMQLLSDAGYPSGFELDVITFSTMRTVLDMSQVLQAQLAEVGIQLNLDIQEFGAFVQNWSNSNFDAFVSQAAGAIDPDAILFRHFHTSGSANVYNYSDPNVDLLLESGQTEVDVVARRAIYEQLQVHLACQGPAVTPALGTLFSAVSEGVNGFQQVPTRSVRYLRTTTLD